jgi:hypothetical protein
LIPVEQSRGSNQTQTKKTKSNELKINQTVTKKCPEGGVGVDAADLGSGEEVGGEEGDEGWWS